MSESQGEHLTRRGYFVTSIGKMLCFRLDGPVAPGTAADVLATMGQEPFARL